ncbi:MAG: DAK2 domain-containing protein [Lachnospiraceae bacterium]|nr:DAK2 domain-containing protein [Lachnospiraceae bacterium]
MFLAGASNLEAKKEWINELNVFPVPDGDTGTNMSMTIMAAAREVSKFENPTLAELAKAISTGSLRGARGNSGVILSQLFRGFTKEIKEVEYIDSEVIAIAFTRAVETAYKAVMKPKEGTILTVAKGVAEKAVEVAQTTDNLDEIFKAALEHGDYVLSQTPEMLPVLKQAGVVDSGGQGLMQILKGCYDAFCGKEIDFTQGATANGSGAVRMSSESIDTSDIKFGYCTEFIIMLEKDWNEKIEKDFKAYLESLGDSIVVVSMDDIVKVHVHTNDPGLAIQKALTFGQLTSMKIDNMREEHEEKLFKEAQKTDTETSEEVNVETNVEEKVEETVDTPVEESATVEEAVETEILDKDDTVVEIKEEPVKAEGPRKPVGFISVSVGEGLSEIFKGLGVDEIIEGGQTMNPSTEDIINAIDKVNADTVYVFPNNSNIILAANQASYLVEDKEVVVIPSKSIPQGITALINFIDERSTEENTERMTEEMTRVKTGQVTYAVRDTELDGFEIKENDIMGIGDKAIVAVGQNINSTAFETINELIDDDSELVSIYYGADMTEEDAEMVAEEITKAYPSVDVEVSFGGQPVYYYIMSVE